MLNPLKNKFEVSVRHEWLVEGFILCLTLHDAENFIAYFIFTYQYSPNLSNKNLS